MRSYLNAYLIGRFSSAQISQFLKPIRTEGTGSRKGKKPITRCKKFTDLDFARAMPKLQISPKLYQVFNDEFGGFNPGTSTLYHKFSFIHVIPGWIKAIFLYLGKKSPNWEPWQCIASMSFDEVYINTSTDIDLICDMPINPDCKANFQMAVIRGTADNWKFPFFAKINHQFTPGDIQHANLALDDAGITLVSTTCDQGPSNIGVASSLNISATNQKVPHPTIPGRFWFYIWDFPHLFKTTRNHFLGTIHTC